MPLHLHVYRLLTSYIYCINILPPRKKIMIILQFWLITILRIPKLYVMYSNFQMDICSYCKSMVPFNTSHCVVCEGPLPGAHITDTKHIPIPDRFLPVSHPLEMPRPAMVNTATQTVGLFYPSTKQIDKSKEKEEDKAAFEKQIRDRRPLLTAISPGRGR